MKRLLFLVLASGCAAATAGDDMDSDTAFSARALEIPAADLQRVLDLVNYPGTDASLLDATVGLDARAAKGIVGARPFGTLADLDAVPYVGDSALTKLEAYAAAHPAPTGETVEGVAFAGWEAQSVVWGVNRATQAELDGVVDSRAAAGLFGKRPFATVADMGLVAYVGPTALARLRGHAPVFWAALRGAPALGGTFDSVAFDEPTAATALAIANGATAAELAGHGVTSTAAAKILAGRPFTTLAAVSNLTGVGTATMSALRGYAQSGAWGAPAPADCVASFDDAVGPHLPDLLFLSESDRPLELVSFPGQGTVKATPASLVALVHPEAGSTAELRDPANYFGDLEPGSATADAGAAAAVQAAYAAQLTDVVYIVIYPPRSSYNHAEMGVYLVGRTVCGDLVGIRSISVET